MAKQNKKEKVCYSHNSPNCENCFDRGGIEEPLSSKPESWEERFDKKILCKCDVDEDEVDFDNPHTISNPDKIKQFISHQREEVIKTTSKEVVDIMMKSKATFFVPKDKKVRISTKDQMYELKAEMITNVEMYFYNLLTKLKKGE